MAIERASKPAATALGLFLALGVPLIVMPTGLLRSTLTQIAPSGSLAFAGLREIFFWSITIAVLLVLRYGEGLKFSDIGWKRPRWTTLLWGVVGFVVIYAAQPLGVMLLRSVGGAAPTGVIAKLVGVPIWLIGLTVLRAGVCEEILFRGYGIERLTALTGSRTIGILIPALVFMMGHMEAYGIKYLMFLIPVTTILTALYVWRRDLWANILAHFLVDAVGLAFFFVSQHPH
jgi:membrane protease YdiL (CAAX protease family)